MTDRTINDADQGFRPVKKPEPQNVYGATMSDGGAGTAAGLGAGASACDDYQVVHVIGRGGMGTISLAKHVQLNRWVALKRMSAQFADDSRLLERFRTEARSVAALTHFHIVHVYAMAEDQEGPYIAMEYVAGPDSAHRDDWPPELPNPPLDLEEFVKKQGVLDVARAVPIARKLCSAVAYAHKHGVIHRDIKPANVVMNEEGEPKLTDFGLARLGGQERQGMTMAGAQLLTLDYGAPEQEIDASSVDERADIYALGATFWFLLTGQSPRHFRESEVPDPVRSILIKALQKDREKRFQTAGEMEQALARLSPQTEGAFQPQGQEPTPGRCPKCGHQHLIIQRKAFDRKFCESCGNTLLEPCLKCKAENGVWSKFCGRCGADLAASLQTAVKQLQADREQVTSLCKASRFTEALECLMGMSLVDHPRLVEYEEWANETVPKVKADFEKAKLQRNCAIEKAKPLMKACDFAGAILALQAIAEPLQTQQSRELVLSAQVAVAEIGVLRDEIRSRMMSNQPEGVKSKVARLIELQPNDPQLPPLLQRLEAWEVRQQKDREARELRQQQQLWQAASSPPSIEGYRQYLDAYPNGIYVEQAKQALAPFLRKKLLQDLNNIGLRKDYLDKRTPSLAAMDEQMALEGSRIAYAVAAGIGGGLGGAFVGGVADWFGALLAGLVTGIAVTLFLDK